MFYGDKSGFLIIFAVAVSFAFDLKIQSVHLCPQEHQNVNLGEILRSGLWNIVYTESTDTHTHTAGQQQNIIPPLSMVGASIKIPTKASL